MIEIREITTRKEQKIFAEFPKVLYGKVPQAIPDLVSEERDMFRPKKNPAYEFCRAKQFLAYRDGRCVGRIAGIINKAANEKWHTRRIRFSRLDFIDDPKVSEALLEAVMEWGRQEGLAEIHGPLGFSDMDQEGMLVEGFQEEGMFLTIYNHPYYVKHMEAMGFQRDTDWVEFQVKIPKESNEKIDLLSAAVLKKYKVRLIEPKSRSEIKPYLTKIFDLYNITYENLYGTVKLSYRQIMKYYKQFILMINPQYLKLLVDEEEQVVGFGLAMPSLNKAAKKSNGRLLPLGWYRIIRAPYAKTTKVLDLYLIGVLPSMQNKGMTAVLMNSMAASARKNGFEIAETGPELENNYQVQALWKHYDTRQHKRRRCWVRTIEKGNGEF